MSNLFVKFHIIKDAWNWWDACNKVSHGVDWKMFVDPVLRKKIVGKKQKEAYSFLIPYLKEMHRRNSLKEKARKLEEDFDQVKDELFQRMARLTKQKIYRNDFTCFLTTFPRFPYNYKKGYVWLSYKRDLDFQISIFIHELLHFQFFEYYGEKVWDILGPEKYQYLKEAMTVILNEEFNDLTLIKDEGYKIHQPLRKKLLKIWLETKNFDIFLDQAIEAAKDFKIKLIP